MENAGALGRQPRRKFLVRLLAGAAATLAAAALPRRARAEAREAREPDSGPILYRRTEEAERYYRTLYYR
jgi:hypothetical protein